MIYYIDLFCGAGGTTEGVRQAENCKVIACVNHDKTAIESHKVNHPEAVHFVEDVRNEKVMQSLRKMVEDIRATDPQARIIIWASLECTNFSKAKGGQPRDPDSRTLAECLYKYHEYLNPDGIWIENVVEFMAWGPLDENGKPLSRRNGSDYMKWVNKLCSYGYSFDYKILNAADFGAYTSRVRYFGQFVRKGLPLVWPEPTHTKTGHSDAFGTKKKWRAVKDVLDFSDKGNSIFTRKKPLSENTLKRIYAGLVKYVAGGDDSFIKKYYSGSPMGKVSSEDSPLGTIRTVDGHALVQMAFLSQQKGGNPDHKVYAVERPSRTVTTAYHDQLIQPEFMVKNYSAAHNHQPADQPCGTLTTKDRFAAVWVDKQYRSDKNHQSVNRPAGSILANDKHCLMQAFIVKNFSQGGQHNVVDGPAGSLLTVPKENLVQLESWIMDTNFGNTGKSLDNPAPTIMACRKHHYLVNPQFSSAGADPDKPCFTLIARMDKKPPYLVQVKETEQLAVIIYPEDSETLRKIKLFMASYGISDIYMRMLRVDELLKIQGFPDNYVLKGTKTEQKKFIGNSVVPVIAEALAEAQAKRWNTINQQKSQSA